MADLKSQMQAIWDQGGSSIVAAPSVARPRRLARFSGLGWRRARWGYVFIAPWLIGFLAFTAHPDGRHARLHVHQHQPRAGGAARRSSGLRNYETLVSDQRTWDSLGVTFKYALLALPVAVCLPFLVALTLQSRHLRGAGAFRVLFFLPYVVPFVAGVFIWGGMLGGRHGLGERGAARPSAGRIRPTGCRTRRWIYPGLVIMGVWGIGAGMIVYLAGLKGIPSDLYEAAKIDGAGSFASLRHITIPMMSPVIFYTIVLAVGRGAAVLPRARSSSSKGPASLAAPRSSSTSTCTRTSSRSRTCPMARRWPGSCSPSPSS